MSTGDPTLAVVVVAARGGAALRAALEAAAWADTRVVLTGDRPRAPRLDSGEPLLTTVREVAALAVDWVLLLGESERIAGADIVAVRSAVRRAQGDEVFTLQAVTSALDLSVRSRFRLARLAPRRTPIVARPGRGIEFDRTRTRVRPLSVDVIRTRGSTLGEAMEIAAAEATTLAALVHATGDRSHGLVRQPVAASLRSLTARSLTGRLGLGRWVIAVLEGYCVVIAQTKVWELRRDSGPVFG